MRRFPWLLALLGFHCSDAAPAGPTATEGECEHVALHVSVKCGDTFDVDACTAECFEGGHSAAEVTEVEDCVHSADDCDGALACVHDGDVC